MQDFDVIVIGGGNAGLCAALSAREQGARVALLERAPEELRGGNSAHTGGAFRVVYDGLDDIRRLVPDLSDDEAALMNAKLVLTLANHIGDTAVLLQALALCRPAGAGPQG